MKSDPIDFDESGDTQERMETNMARLLSLAPAPVFALMALLTAGSAGSAGANMICGESSGGSLLGGMMPMYLLMSAFHAAPWLKLIGVVVSNGRSRIRALPSGVRNTCRIS